MLLLLRGALRSQEEVGHKELVRDQFKPGEREGREVSRAKPDEEICYAEEHLSLGPRIESLRVANDPQDVNQDAVVGLLVKVSFPQSVIFLHYLIDRIEHGRKEVMLVHSVTARGEAHEGDNEEVKEALYVSVDESVSRPLGNTVILIQGTLHTQLKHGLAELLNSLMILVEAKLLKGIKEAVDYLLLLLSIADFLEGNNSPLFEVLPERFLSPSGPVSIVLNQSSEILRHAKILL